MGKDFSDFLFLDAPPTLKRRLQEDGHLGPCGWPVKNHKLSWKTDECKLICQKTVWIFPFMQQVLVIWLERNLMYLAFWGLQESGEKSTKILEKLHGKLKKWIPRKSCVCVYLGFHSALRSVSATNVWKRRDMFFLRFRIQVSGVQRNLLKPPPVNLFFFPGTVPHHSTLEL